jgi:hypothetical protein
VQGKRPKARAVLPLLKIHTTERTLRRWVQRYFHCTWAALVAQTLQSSSVSPNYGPIFVRSAQGTVFREDLEPL